MPKLKHTFDLCNVSQIRLLTKRQDKSAGKQSFFSFMKQTSFQLVFHQHRHSILIYSVLRNWLRDTAVSYTHLLRLFAQNEVYRTKKWLVLVPTRNMLDTTYVPLIRLVFVIRVVPCVTVIPLVFEIPSILNTRYWLFLAFQRYFCTPSIWPCRIRLRDTCVLCVCVCVCRCVGGVPRLGTSRACLLYTSRCV